MTQSPTRHEDRFLAILEHAVHGADVVQEVTIPRKARRLDAVVRLIAPPELFGVLGPWLSDRAVVFEHESEPLTQETVASAAIGPVWLHWHRLRRASGRVTATRRAVSGTQRPPVGVVVADRAGQNLTGAVAGLRPGPWTGVWCTPHVDEGGVVVLDTSQLVGVAGLEFWAWLGGAPTPDEAAARYALLIDSLSLSTLTRTRLIEAMMNEQIPSTSAEQETNYQRVTRVSREQGREEGREEGRTSLLALLRRYAPDRYAELRDVHDLVVLQRALDEVLQKNLPGV